MGNTEPGAKHPPINYWTKSVVKGDASLFEELEKHRKSFLHPQKEGTMHAPTQCDTGRLSNSKETSEELSWLNLSTTSLPKVQIQTEVAISQKDEKVAQAMKEYEIGLMESLVNMGVDITPIKDDLWENDE
jgi:hypothetical protein